MFRSGRLIGTALVMIGLATMLFRPGHAGSFSVRPTAIVGAGGITVLTVTNDQASRLYVEAALFSWQPDGNGGQLLVPAGNDTMVSPPAAWIPAGTSYQFRVLLPPPPDHGERAWRFELTEVPSREEIAAGRVVLALTQSLPAFSTAPSAAPPALSGHRTGPSGLTICNAGGRRVRLANIAEGQRMLIRGLAGYALAQSCLRIPLSASVVPGRVTFDTDLGRRVIDVN